jgi:DNA invertase Pin-like site-specific DNA recombinase
MRAIGYFRETKGRSLSDQSEAFIAFCKANGFEAAATFLDAKDNGDLSGFRQMIEFARHQEGQGFLLLVVPDLLTLGAGPVEAARRYFQLTSLNIPIVGIDDGNEISVALLETWAAARSNGSVGDRVKAAMRKKAVRGEALGRPPYGYRVGPKRRLVVVPEEGAIVRYIFRLYLKDGLGIRRIARRLNEENLTTRRGGLWSMVTVRDILRNRAYVGTYSRFGVRVPASHAPLISQDDFQRVQSRLDERKPSSAARQVSPFLLSGFTFCGYCGNKMIGVTRKQKWKRADGSERTAQYRYYQCESRTNRSLCDYHTKRAEDLEKQVYQALFAASLPTNGNGHSLDPEAAITRLRDRVRRLDKRLEQYMDAAAGGTLNPEKLQTAAVAIATEQMQLEDRLLEANRAAHQHAGEEERRKGVEKTLRRLREEWDELPFIEKQELMRDAIERITVRDDEVQLGLRS